MKNNYFIKSSRYGYTHKFILNNEKERLYVFKPQEEWMPLYFTSDDKSLNNIKGVDTDGGPYLFVGWSNNEITIEEIKVINSNVFFKLKKK